MHRQLFLLVLLLSHSTLWAFPSATTNPDVRPTADTAVAPLGEADHEALRTLLSKATDALNRIDDQALKPYLADGFVLILADQTVITDSGQLHEYFDRYFRAEGALLKAVHFDPKPSAPTRFIDSHSGVVYGSSKDTYTLADDSTLSLDTRWTATVIKQQGRWQIQSFHAGVNMVDNPILDALGQQLYLWSGISLASGLLIGLFLARIVRRRNRA